MGAVPRTSAGRPLAVTVAVALLWANLALALANLVVVSPEAFRDWVLNLGTLQPRQIPIFVAIYAVCTFLVIGIGRGRSWCRWAYLPIAAAGVVRAAMETREMGAAIERLSSFPAVWQPPGPMDPFDGTSFPPGLLGMVPEEWRIVYHLIIIVQAMLLAVAILLLFTPRANRWFRSGMN